jgi:hypothetical protein
MQTCANFGAMAFPLQPITGRLGSVIDGLVMALPFTRLDSETLTTLPTLNQINR